MSIRAFARPAAGYPPGRTIARALIPAALLAAAVAAEAVHADAPSADIAADTIRVEGAPWTVEAEVLRLPYSSESRNADAIDTLGKRRPMQTAEYAWLIGMTDDSDERLLERARSYTHPPKITLTGGEYEGWQADRRAHRISVTDSTLVIQISPQVTCVNPVFELVKADRELTEVSLDGHLLRPEEYAWDGQTLWLARDITAAATLRLTLKDR